MLSELSGYGSWTVRYTRPPEYRHSSDIATLEPAAIAARLERAGAPQEAVTALRSSFPFSASAWERGWGAGGDRR